MFSLKRRKITKSKYQALRFRPRVEQLEDLSLLSASSLLPVDIIEIENNDILTTAQSLGSIDNNPYDLCICGNIGNGLGNTRDVDWYQFQINGPAQVSLTLSGASAGSMPLITLVSANNDSSVEWIDQGPDVLDQILSAGTYFIAVSGGGNSGFDPYQAASGVDGVLGDYTVLVETNSIFALPSESARPVYESAPQLDAPQAVVNPPVPPTAPSVVVVVSESSDPSANVSIAPMTLALSSNGQTVDSVVIIPAVASGMTNPNDTTNPACVLTTLASPSLTGLESLTLELDPSRPVPMLSKINPIPSELPIVQRQSVLPDRLNSELLAIVQSPDRPQQLENTSSPAMMATPVAVVELVPIQSTSVAIPEQEIVDLELAELDLPIAERIEPADNIQIPAEFSALPIWKYCLLVFSITGVLLPSYWYVRYRRNLTRQQLLESSTSHGSVA